MEDFDIVLTHMIQLRKSNQQMVQNIYFKTIKGQVMTQDQESALIKRNHHNNCRYFYPH